MPITAETLRKHKTGPWFIETGCEDGNGVQAALDAGFDAVCSIELNRRSVDRVRQRFLGRPVTIMQGSSPLLLPQVLREIKMPVTFWLDAHPEDWSPVLQELAALREHPIKTHTILIDDRRLMHGAWKEITEDKVRAALLSVNPDYVISLDYGVTDDDIIVAKAPA
jgi:hypothetical protein